MFIKPSGSLWLLLVFQFFQFFFEFSMNIANISSSHQMVESNSLLHVRYLRFDPAEGFLVFCGAIFCLIELEVLLFSSHAYSMNFNVLYFWLTSILDGLDAPSF